MAGPAPPRTMPSRTRTTLLVMSLALNVGLIALILVGIGRAGQRLAARPGMMAPAQIARTLPDEGRQKVLDVIAEHRDALRERRRAARAARLEVFRAFTAPTYMAGDLDRALEQVRLADAALEQEAVAEQRDVINALTPGERKEIAARLRERRGRPWWRRIL